MLWSIVTGRKVQKQYRSLPKRAKESFFALLLEIELDGPVRGNWPNYGKIGKRRHHCHIKKGHPTYVAVWEELPQESNHVEVIYVGTHERAPY